MKKRLSLLLFCTALLLPSALTGCSPARGTETDEPENAAVFEYETQELWVRKDGRQIYGIIYIPQEAGEKMPAVIFSHGFGGSYRVGTSYAEKLAQNGYVVYCFDFCGGSPESRSDGSTLEMSAAWCSFTLLLSFRNAPTKCSGARKRSPIPSTSCGWM